MIGQKKLLNRINELIEIGFPRFIILNGDIGSGKLTIAKEITSKLKAQQIIVDRKVKEVREAVELSYNQTQPTVYILPNADEMSLPAKNALLKVTEEPPKQAYFIMTVTNMSNMLDTLISRAYVLTLDPYSPNELQELINWKRMEFDPNELKILLNICTTPGEIILLSTYNIMEFKEFVINVVNGIGKVNGPNAFKIANKIKTSKEGPGYEPEIFYKAVMYYLLEAMKLNPNKNIHNAIHTTSKYLQELKVTGINKASTIDMWILDIRRFLK